MDGIRIPSSRPVVVDSATILVPILKHSMNLEIDAVVVLALNSEALSATYNQCIARILDFILLYLCNNEFAVSGSAVLAPI
jgi:hypothetical protein